MKKMTKTLVKKEDPVISRARALRKHQEFLRKMGYRKRTKKERLEAYRDNYLRIFGPNSEPPGGLKLPKDPKEILAAAYKRKDVLHDYKWKRGRKEKSSTIKAIQEKTSRIAPAYSKGSLQYISDKADVETLGKKV